jgi:pimeloyl-ACP methyl ester carboxylesterase
MTRDLFVATLRLRLYSERAAVHLPRAIHRAYLGDFTDMAHAALRLHDFAASFAEGLYLSTACTEGLARLDPNDIRRHAAGTLFGPATLLARHAACHAWPQGDPAAALDPVPSLVPTLLLTGRRDPVTPSDQAARIARTLPQSHHLTLPTAHHTFDSPCLTHLIATFLADPVAPPDATCLATIPPRPFDLLPPPTP